MNKTKDIRGTISIIILTITLKSCTIPQVEKTETIFAVSISYDYHNYLKNEIDRSKPVHIHARNILHIKCDSDGNCSFDGNSISKDSIRSEVIRLLKSDPNAPHMPLLKEKTYKHIGRIQIPSLFIINAEFSKKTEYSTYFEIREEIIRAYSDVRNELAISKLGKSITQLIESNNAVDGERLNEIYNAYPIRYTERLNN